MSDALEQKPATVSRTVRTSISISKAARDKGKRLMDTEGYSSFSDMVEYLIRHRDDSQQAA